MVSLDVKHHVFCLHPQSFSVHGTEPLCGCVVYWCNSRVQVLHQKQIKWEWVQRRKPDAGLLMKRPCCITPTPRTDSNTNWKGLSHENEQECPRKMNRTDLGNWTGLSHKDEQECPRKMNRTDQENWTGLTPENEQRWPRRLLPQNEHRLHPLLPRKSNRTTLWSTKCHLSKRRLA